VFLPPNYERGALTVRVKLMASPPAMRPSITCSVHEHHRCVTLIKRLLLRWGWLKLRLAAGPSGVTEPMMDLGRVLLRVTIGGTFFVHGTQKLLGWFGGHGPSGTGQFFESLGLRPGRRNAIAAGATETGCGILLALGSATPLAAAGLSAVMITALRTAVWSEGIKPATGEFEVLLTAGALALTETGPGSPSLDTALGVQRSGRGWVLVALGAGAAGSAIAIESGRRHPEAPGAAAPAESPATPQAPPAPEATTT
jgi:putative oxidoreductase